MLKRSNTQATKETNKSQKRHGTMGSPTTHKNDVATSNKSTTRKKSAPKLEESFDNFITEYSSFAELKPYDTYIFEMEDEYSNFRQMVFNKNLNVDSNDLKDQIEGFGMSIVARGINSKQKLNQTQKKTHEKLKDIINQVLNPQDENKSKASLKDLSNWLKDFEFPDLPFFTSDKLENYYFKLENLKEDLQNISQNLNNEPEQLQGFSIELTEKARELQNILNDNKEDKKTQQQKIENAKKDKQNMIEKAQAEMQMIEQDRVKTLKKINDEKASSLKIKYGEIDKAQLEKENALEELENKLMGVLERQKLEMEFLESDFKEKEVNSPGKVNLEDIYGTKVSAKPKVFLVTGGPGSGKATQCKKISKKYGFVHLSTGDLLRKEVKSGSNKGVQLQKMMSEGGQVSTIDLLGLLKKEMKINGWAKTFLIDGFPRNQENINCFKEILEDQVDLLGTFFFELDSQTMKERCLARNLNRKDDTEKTIKKKLETYTNETLPVINEMQTKGNVTKIDAKQSIGEVYENICNIIDNIIGKKERFYKELKAIKEALANLILGKEVNVENIKYKIEKETRETNKLIEEREEILEQVQIDKEEIIKSKIQAKIKLEKMLTINDKEDENLGGFNSIVPKDGIKKVNLAQALFELTKEETLKALQLERNKSLKLISKFMLMISKSYAKRSLKVKGPNDDTLSSDDDFDYSEDYDLTGEDIWLDLQKSVCLFEEIVGTNDEVLDRKDNEISELRKTLDEIKSMSPLKRSNQPTSAKRETASPKKVVEQTTKQLGLFFSRLTEKDDLEELQKQLDYLQDDNIAKQEEIDRQIEAYENLEIELQDETDKKENQVKLCDELENKVKLLQTQLYELGKLYDEKREHVEELVAQVQENKASYEYEKKNTEEKNSSKLNNLEERLIKTNGLLEKSTTSLRNLDQVHNTLKADFEKRKGENEALQKEHTEVKNQLDSTQKNNRNMQEEVNDKLAELKMTINENKINTKESITELEDENEKLDTEMANTRAENLIYFECNTKLEKENKKVNDKKDLIRKDNLRLEEELKDLKDKFKGFEKESMQIYERVKDDSKEIIKNLNTLNTNLVSRNEKLEDEISTCDVNLENMEEQLTKVQEKLEAVQIQDDFKGNKLLLIYDENTNLKVKMGDAEKKAKEQEKVEICLRRDINRNLNQDFKLKKQIKELEKQNQRFQNDEDLNEHKKYISLKSQPSYKKFF